MPNTTPHTTRKRAASGPAGTGSTESEGGMSSRARGKRPRQMDSLDTAPSRGSTLPRFSQSQSRSHRSSLRTRDDPPRIKWEMPTPSGFRSSIPDGLSAAASAASAASATSAASAAAAAAAAVGSGAGPAVESAASVVPTAHVVGGTNVALRARKKRSVRERRKNPDVDPDRPRPQLQGARMVTSVHVKQLVHLTQVATQRGDVDTAAAALEALIPKGAELVSWGIDYNNVAVVACRSAVELIRSHRSHLNLCGRLLNIMKLLSRGDEKRRLDLEHAALLCAHGKSTEAATICKAAALEVSGSTLGPLYLGYVGLVEAAIWEANIRTAHDASAKVHGLEALEYLQRAVSSAGVTPEPAVFARYLQLVHSSQGPAAAVAAGELVAAAHLSHGPTLQLMCRAIREVEPPATPRELEYLRALAQADPLNSELEEAVRVVLADCKESDLAPPPPALIAPSPSQTPTPPHTVSSASSTSTAAHTATPLTSSPEHTLTPPSPPHGECASAGAAPIASEHTPVASEHTPMPTDSGTRRSRPVLAVSDAVREGPVYEELAIEHVASLIEHHDPGAHLELVPLWRQFRRLLDRVTARFIPTLDPTAAQLQCWTSRLQWWAAAYFSPHPVRNAAPALLLELGSDAEQMYNMRVDLQRCATLMYGPAVAQLIQLI